MDPEKMINENLGLVRLAIRQLRIPPEHTDDCFQEGIIALYLATTRFDESTGNQFSTFAVPWIKGQIKRYLRDTHLVKAPRSVWANRINIKRMRDEGYDDDYIMQKLGITSLQFADADSLMDITSIDFEVEDGISVSELIPDNSEYVEDLVSLQEYFIELAERVVANFDELDANICMESLCSRMYEDKPISQMDLAIKYNKAQPTISRLLRKFYKMLKEQYYEEN